LNKHAILLPAVISLLSLVACSGTSNSTPSITSQPTSRDTVVGRPVKFKVSVKGHPTPDIVWQKDGVNITSETSSSYVLVYPKTTDAGAYTVYATNDVGSATSNAATLTVYDVPDLERPFGLTTNGSGTFYVTDTNRHTIQKLTTNTDGTITPTPLAGNDGVSGFGNGLSSAASFNSPEGLALDGSGNLYVADYGNHAIRKIDSDGNVTTFAGTGSAGTTDGAVTSAQFNHPIGLAFNADYSALYVADSGNHTIRKIDMGTLPMVVSTFAGTTGSPGTSASLLSSPNGVAVITSSSIDTLYVTDYGSSTIRKITSSGTISTLAGYSGDTGTSNGSGTGARFYQPVGIAVDLSGNLLVADTYNHGIRKVTTSGVVTTLAGELAVSGNEDESGTSAHFYRPSGLCVDSTGYAYVTDYKNGLIRRISTGGVVATLTTSGVIATDAYDD